MSFSGGKEPRVFRNTQKEIDQINAYRKKVLAEVEDIKATKAAIVAEYDAKIEAAAQKLEKLATTRSDYEKYLATLQKQYQDQEAALAALRKEYSDLQETIIKDKKDAEASVSRIISGFKSEEASLLASINKCQTRLEDINLATVKGQEEKDALEKEEDRLEAILSDLSGKIAGLKAKEIGLLGEVEQAKNAWADLTAQLTSKHNELSVVNDAIALATDAKEKLLADIAELEKERPEFEAEKTRLSELGSFLQGEDLKLKVREKALHNGEVALKKAQKELKEAQEKI